MASVSSTFTGVGQSATLSVPAKGEAITIALSGTYDMTIRLERAMGPDGTAWEVVAGPWTTANETVSEVYTSRISGEQYRLNCTVDNSGTCTYTISDGDLQIRQHEDQEGNASFTETQEHVSFPKRLIAAAGFNAEGRVILRTTDGLPLIGKMQVPETDDTTGTAMSEAQLLAGIHVKTPVAAQNFQVPTGTEIATAINALLTGDEVLTIGDYFDWTLINLGGAGDIITLTVDTGVTFIGSVTLDDAGADIDNSGTWRFHYTAANVFVAYRLG